MKDLNRIEEILDKYYRGETSTDEEILLRKFFSESEIPEHLKAEARLFAYYSGEKEDTLTGEMEKRLENIISGYESRTPVLGINRRYYWLGAAAVILILLGIFLDTQIRRNSTLVVRQDSFEDPYLAYIEAKKVLYLVSENINIARKPLEHIEKLDAGVNYMHPVFSFGAGLQHLEHLSTIEKTRKRISK